MKVHWQMTATHFSSLVTGRWNGVAVSVVFPIVVIQKPEGNMARCQGLLKLIDR